MTQKKANTPAPMIITLTLPEPGCDGSLIAQRGDLAHISQFAHTPATDFASLIRLAIDALSTIEANPPVVPEPPPPKKTKTTRQSVTPATPPEPMRQVPVAGKKKGRLTKSIPARCLQLPDDEAAQKIGLEIAGKLLDSELWDGQVPIRIGDPAAVQRKLKGLTTKEMKGLFTLDQFVAVNPPEATNTDPAATAETETAELEVQAS